MGWFEDQRQWMGWGGTVGFLLVIAGLATHFVDDRLAAMSFANDGSLDVYGDAMVNLGFIILASAIVTGGLLYLASKRKEQS